MEDLDVLSLIPQKPPFVMVDKLLFADEKNAKSKFTINETNVLVHDGSFSEAGLIENMAQTAALHAGYQALQSGKKPALGVIGGVKNLLITRLPRVHGSITTSVSVENEVMNAKILKGQVLLDNEIIAECEMKVFLL